MLCVLQVICRSKLSQKRENIRNEFLESINRFECIVNDHGNKIRALEKEIKQNKQQMQDQFRIFKLQLQEAHQLCMDMVNKEEESLKEQIVSWKRQSTEFYNRHGRFYCMDGVSSVSVSSLISDDC